MNEDRFSKHVTFSTGVRWEPTTYKLLDQTPYLDYLDREEEKNRETQGLISVEETRVSMGLPPREKNTA